MGAGENRQIAGLDIAALLAGSQADFEWIGLRSAPARPPPHPAQTVMAAIRQAEAAWALPAGDKNPRGPCFRELAHYIGIPLQAAQGGSLANFVSGGLKSLPPRERAGRGNLEASG